jgi:hypothetical protein
MLLDLVGHLMPAQNDGNLCKLDDLKQKKRKIYGKNIVEFL